MTTMTLQWRKPKPTIITRWRGPSGRVTAIKQSNPLTPIAAVIGPVGPRGGVLRRAFKIVSAPNVTPNSDTTDIVVVTALAEDITISNPTGSPEEAQMLIFKITDDGTGRAIAWGSAFKGGSISLPGSTLVGKTIHLGFMFDVDQQKWCLMAFIFTE